MGFFDAYKAGLAKGQEKGKEETQRIQNDIQRRAEKERQEIARVTHACDEDLFRMVRSSSTSDRDRKLAEETLCNRGYYMNSRGQFDKR